MPDIFWPWVRFPYLTARIKRKISELRQKSFSGLIVKERFIHCLLITYRVAPECIAARNIVTKYLNFPEKFTKNILRMFRCPVRKMVHGNAGYDSEDASHFSHCA
jgi:hypothetical protein